jgi:hypothetical protein
MTAISRHYRDSHIKTDNFDTRVAIYEDQIRGWFHDQARILEKSSNAAGFVILMIVLMYIEAYAIFFKGEDSKNKSKSFFRDAFKEIFPLTGDDPDTIDSAIDELYDQTRNGLFHTGITRSKVILSGEFESPVQVHIDAASKRALRIDVNPHRMLDHIEDHLAHYVMRLRDPSEQQLRENFNKAWMLRFD